MKTINFRYEIIEILGKGGIGITYKSKDLETNQLIAIKVISFRQITEWKTLDLFEREVRVLKQLDHPAVPKYLDSFEFDTEEDRLFCIVQALAPGKNLVQWMHEGWRPTETEVQAIALQLLEVLIYLQKLTPAIIHRDIKPQNILRDENGQVYLVDFGAVQDNSRQTITGGSTVIGTFGYMAPEQFRGQSTLSTDLFGLGTTLVSLLTGKDPMDLPQTDNLKFSLPENLSITLPFRNWLENLIEPAVEDRCPSAADAILYFQGQEQPITSEYSFIQRPKQTSINLTKTQSYLRINFLPKNFRNPEVLAAIFTTIFCLIYFLLSFYCLIFFGVFSPTNIVLNIIILVFSGLVFAAGIRSTQLLVKPFNLLANEEFICFRGVLKPWSFYQEISLNINHVDEVYLKKINSSTTRCLIKTVEYEKFYLGACLSSAENRWLVHEIQDFIQQVKSNTFLEKHKKLMALNHRSAIAIDTILMKGIFCYGKQELRNAKNIFEIALLIEPDCAEAHNNLGVTQVWLEEYSKAIESFHYALHFAPSYWAAKNNLAIAYELNGDLKNSIKTYVSPCPALQKKGLDEHTLLIGNETQNTLAENINRLQSENPFSSVSLKTKCDYACFLQIQGNNEAAIHAYRDAQIMAENRTFYLTDKELDGFEQRANIYANLGWILAMSNQVDEGLKYLKKSYSMYRRLKNSNTPKIQALIEHYDKDRIAAVSAKLQ